MRFSTLLVAAFASAATAQNAASMSAYSSAFSSLFASLTADSSFLQQVIGLATNPALVSTLQALQSSVPDPKSLTTTPAFFSDIPSSILPLFTSIYSKEVGIAKQYGVYPTASSTGGTSSGAAAGGSTATTSGATTSATGSTTTSASSSSSTGAAPSAGVAAMGLAAGLIGGIAVLL